MKQLSKERLKWIAADGDVARGEIKAMARALLAGIAQEPMAWPNHCDESVPAALRYLAEKPRPVYGNSPYNTEHLYQLAREIEAMAGRSLYAAPPAPAKNYQAIVERIAEIVHGSVTDIDLLTVTIMSLLRKAREPVSNPCKLLDAWVPCRERLPEPNVYVLVSNGVWVGQGLHSDGEHLGDDERWQDEHQEFIDLLHHPVTHWQPLPAPPKEV